MSRSKNFNIGEDRVLQEGFAKHRDFLTSAQTNKVTKKVKNELWNSLAASVSSLGYENRDATACKVRWKNLSSNAKKGVQRAQKLPERNRWRSTSKTTLFNDSIHHRPLERYHQIQGWLEWWLMVAFPPFRFRAHPTSHFLRAFQMRKIQPITTKNSIHLPLFFAPILPHPSPIETPFNCSATYPILRNHHQRVVRISRRSLPTTSPLTLSIEQHQTNESTMKRLQTFK